MPTRPATSSLQSPLPVGRARLWLSFVGWFGVFRELGPLGLLVEPDSVVVCWRRVSKVALRLRPRLADRLFIAAAKKVASHG